jgi:hypothetical protein
VFRGEAHPFERTHPFGAVADALDLRRRSPHPRRAMIGGLLVGGAEWPRAAGGAPDLRYQIVEEILDLLEAAAAAGPVVLVLEDVHWADDSTLLAFRSMVRPLAHVPLLPVASLRPAPRSAELDQLLSDDPACQHAGVNRPLPFTLSGRRCAPTAGRLPSLNVPSWPLMAALAGYRPRADRATAAVIRSM